MKNIWSRLRNQEVPENRPNNAASKLMKSKFFKQHKDLSNKTENESENDISINDLIEGSIAIQD